MKLDELRKWATRLTSCVYRTGRQTVWCYHQVYGTSYYFSIENKTYESAVKISEAEAKKWTAILKKENRKRSGT
jgi:hypothetical protein